MRISQLVVCFLSLALLAVSTFFGFLMAYLSLFLLVSAITMVVVLVTSLVKKRIFWNAYGEAGSRAYILQSLLRNVAWITIGACIYIAFIPIEFPYTGLTVAIWIVVAVVCILDWIPRKLIGKYFNITLSLFTLFLVYQLAMVYWPIKSTTAVVLAPPFKGEWYVFHGGNSPLINRHHFVGSEQYAMDILLPGDGKLPFENVTDLDKYETFGKSLLSPVDGVVAYLENSLADQLIGNRDATNPYGNHIVIKTEPEVFVLMAHLQKDSVLVSEGDQVTIGQEIARIGNSGNTSQPHLHIQAMTREDFLDTNTLPLPISFTVANQDSRFFKRNDSLLGLSE